RGVGFDRDRSFYPVIMVVIAFYYVLFAVMGGSGKALALELLVSAVFIFAAVIGFKTSLWIVAGALVGHGTQDIFHGDMIANPGVPAWWPMFCATIDLVLGGYLAWLLLRGYKPGIHAQQDGAQQDGI